MFESWSPEIQEQLLAEWNDWQDEPKKSGYMCDQCDKVFSRSSALRRHVQSLHSERGRHTCDLCEKSFASKDNMRRHTKTHQEKVFECHKCHRKFDRKVFIHHLR